MNCNIMSPEKLKNTFEPNISSSMLSYTKNTHYMPFNNDDIKSFIEPIPLPSKSNIKCPKINTAI